MKAVIGGVGYRDLCDHSVGPMVSDVLEAADLPSEVVADDLSFNPVAVGQWLKAMEAEERPHRLILIGAVERGRNPGAYVAYRWDRELPDEGRIQEAVADAVTGVILLDNTLIVLAQFGPLPPEVVVVEIEPEVEAFGEELSPRLQPLLNPLCELALKLATDDEAVSTLSRHPLGGPPVLGRPLAKDPAPEGPRIEVPFLREVRRL